MVSPVGQASFPPRVGVSFVLHVRQDVGIPPWFFYQTDLINNFLNTSMRGLLLSPPLSVGITGSTAALADAADQSESTRATGQTQRWHRRLPYPHHCSVRVLIRTIPRQWYGDVNGTPYSRDILIIRSIFPQVYVPPSPPIELRFSDRPLLSLS
jgi:hypothetical protein